MNTEIVFEEELTDKYFATSRYLCYFKDEFRGMVVVGNTKEQAFEELMISLKVKIAYDNNISI